MLLKLCKNVYISTQATVIVEIYTITIARPFIILFISRSLPFFSLFSVLNKLNKLSNFSSPHPFLFPQMHTNTPTHKHIHTDKSTQKYTNTPTQTNQRRDRSVLDRNDRCLWNDRCLTGMIGACGSYLIGACGSCLIGVCVSCLIGACASCLIGA